MSKYILAGGEKIQIAFGFDCNFIMQIGITIISICENTHENILFHALISSNVTPEHCMTIEQIVKSYNQHIVFYTIDSEAFNSMPENAHITHSTYNRLLIPKLIPQDIHKVIYLDGDIIVSSSLLSLWQIELDDDTPAAASIDARGSGVIQHNGCDIPLSQIYFNAGVLLYNVDYWRKNRIGEKCINYITESKCPWMDQDAINHVIGSKIKYIHPKYNLQMAFVRSKENEWCVEKAKFFNEIREAIANPVIYHYSEESKPWHAEYTHPGEWLKYKALSPWKNVELVSKNKIKYIWMMDEAFNVDNGLLAENASAYFYIFVKTVRRYPLLLKLVNKTLWLLVKLL